MSADTPALGYIGLGLIGSPMPLRLLDAGYRVTVWNRTRDKMEPALARGARPAASPADVARHSDVVHLCLLDTAAVREVVFGPDGVVRGASASKILVDHSTISADATREMARRLEAETGMRWVDAPVSGGPMGARAGTLVIMAGGEARDIERVRPVVAALSRRFAHMGPLGAGQTTKMCAQVAVACTYCVLAEMVSLARNSGVEVQRLPETLEGSFADSRLLQVMGPRMIAREFAPVGQVKTMLKDLTLLGELAIQTGTALPLTTLATQLFRLHEGQGNGELDITSIVKLFDTGGSPETPRP
ncbi:MAG: NAD(P)-dependent oxidoreductase [Candidatus Rokuibacteriota bacterium]